MADPMAFAQGQATAARALGNGDSERAWLDMCILLERRAAQPVVVTAEQYGRVLDHLREWTIAGPVARGEIADSILAALGIEVAE